jgi:hypothetical protein
MKLGLSFSMNLDKEFDSVKPKIHKIGNAVAFEFLNLINLVFSPKPHLHQVL